MSVLSACDCVKENYEKVTWQGRRDRHETAMEREARTTTLSSWGRKAWKVDLILLKS